MNESVKLEHCSTQTPPVGRKGKRGEGGAYIQKLKSGLIARVNRKMIASSRDLSEEECRGLEMTAAQSEVFLAIDEFWKRYGYAPSLGDIAYMRGKTGKGNIKRIVDGLVALGVVKYMPNKKRSVRPVYLNFRNIQ
jgi:hypothetical protein